MALGARSSSCNEQRVANMIVRILGSEVIRTRMYLDDLIVVAENEEKAWAQYNRVKGLFMELGLPEAEDKAQSPCTKVKWLGIEICYTSMCLSIPEAKLKEIVAEAERCRAKRNIHRKLFECLLGKTLHVAKCVVPARTFLSSMLQAYREAKLWFVKVTAELKADLDWFCELCWQWNGKAVHSPRELNLCVQVGACLSSIGGSDGTRAYSGRLTAVEEEAFNITELEALNVIIALHTFLTDENRGSHVLAKCDNLAAVQALKWGRASNQSAGGRPG